LAVFFGCNLENFAFGVKGGACLQAGHPLPDVLNYSWREYGMRVGVWRMLDLFDELQLPMVNVLNTSCYDDCPAVVKAFSSRNADVLAHGHTNSEAQGLLSTDDERALLRDVKERILSNEKAPAALGWLGPGISESVLTPDLLAEEGYDYVCDWSHDDQPCLLRTRSGKSIVSVPYSLELNDITQIIAHQHTADEFADMMIAQWDEMLGQAKKGQSLVYSANFHPFIIGVPFRLAALRRAMQHIKKSIDANPGVVWLAGPSAIAVHYRTLYPGSTDHCTQ
jgi:allantoinase